MGKIKKKDTAKTHTLDEKEFNHVKLLNIAMNYNVLKDRAISSFLYYVCSSRFDYADNQNLVFELDLENDSHELKVTVVPNEDIEKAIK